MGDKIKLTFLGTAGAIPTVDRNHTSILLSYRDENILVDCGEGTQRQFKRVKISPNKVTKLLITHWHGDHVLGIPGFLQTLAFSDYRKTLEIYGPVGTKKFMKTMLQTFVFSGEVKMKIIEISKEGKFFDSDRFYLSAKKLKHGVTCFGYNFIEKGKLKIDKDKLDKSGLPRGPLMKKLKEGKDVSYKGKKFKAKDLTYGEVDKKISVILDTSYEKKFAKFVDGADVLISEASFDSSFKDAKEYNHMTSEQAATIAKDGNVKRLILIHLSQRYGKSTKKLVDEAKKIFKKTSLAEDLDVVDL
jgi:ribonuclease Z